MNVSIITAAFRTEYINGTWESIKKQTYHSQKWEWILICDDSQEIRDWYWDKKKQGEFENYDVTFIDIHKRQGKYGLVSRNVGVMVSKHDRILFLDDDNEWDEDDVIEALLKAEKETGKIPFMNMHIVGKKPGSTVDRIKKTHFGHQGMDLGCLLYRKEFFKKYGYFDDSELRIEFDWALFQKIFQGENINNFINIDRHLYFRHKRY